ncbi:winged helix-turn-helix transcriptional regulator [Ohtaekwangia koreensis]|nr:winged helix-turn-helix transcriptional regulator [Ohtaekwangia koreensis]
MPVVIKYSLTPYAETLEKVIPALRDWGANHGKQILGK